MVNVEERLKRGIVSILSETALGRAHGPESLERIAKDVLALFRKRVDTPEGQKKKVWAEGEERILRELGKGDLRRTMQEAASSGSKSA
jgi:hypothetical protein